MQIAGQDCNGKEKEIGHHKAASRQKKLKAKTLKWRSSNGDMNGKVEPRETEGVSDGKELCSLSTASFSSLISRKRVRNLGKVAEHCDAIDPPVPRKLRSAINKRVGRFASASSRHVKKRRHLSAISAQISFVDQENRFNGSTLFTEEEEVIADVLLSLSQIPSLCELKADIEDRSNINVASTSYSEGATKEADEMVILPSVANEPVNQAACTDKVAEQTRHVPEANPLPGSTNQSSNTNPPVSEIVQIEDLSLGTGVILPSPSKDSSGSSVRKQLKVQFDDSKSYSAQKPEAPLWLVNSSKFDGVPHEREKPKNNSVREIVPLVQTPLPCTPDGYLIKPSSSKLSARTNAISEVTKFTVSGNQDKHPPVKHVGATKAWKRSIIHVYVSHVIQMHLNKEKASQNQAKPEEIAHKKKAQDEKLYAMHLDVRVPAGRQNTLVSGNFMRLPTSTALPAGPQHVQYLHPHQQQIAAPQGPMPYTFPAPHLLPYSRGNLAPAAALHQQQQVYMCNPGYPPRTGLPASSSAMMKQLQQLIIPAQQQLQQQQQMWQYHHVSQYQQARPDATAAAWQSMSSLRPMAMLPTAATMPAQMELFCAPYQGGRQPQQLRLM